MARSLKSQGRDEVENKQGLESEESEDDGNHVNANTQCFNRAKIIFLCVMYEKCHNI